MPLTRIKSSAIGTDAITSARIDDGAVATVDIADNAVTTAKITDANITTAKIANNAVTTDKVAAGAITAAKLAAGVNTDFDWSDSVKTGNFTAVSGKGYFVNTTSAAITVTLPSSPSAGNKVAIVDYAGTADTNNIKINPAGSDKVEGQSAYDLVISGERTGLELVYKDATQGWLVTNTARSNQTSKVVAAFDNTTALSSFGEGLQGAATSASSVLTVQTHITDNSVAAGATSFTVASATGFSAGKLILIHNTQDASSGYNGYYEYNRIASISGTTINLTDPIIRAKESGAFSGTGEREVTQVVLVNEFTDLTLTGETVSADAWNGSQSGGILAIWCTGTLTLAGSILNANTKGLQGGQSASTSNDGDNQTGMGNRGYLQLGRTGLGGAGGGGRQNTPGSTPQGDGGGAGHGAAGDAGNGGNFGLAGVAIGQQDLLLDSGGTGIFNLGPGGGAGGYDYSNAGGNGGYGGGAIIINAKTIVSTGTSVIRALPEAGGSGSGGGKGGGGAGGSIAINCETLTKSSGTLTITADGVAANGGGGAGAVGRIHIRGTQSGSPTVTPAAYTG